MIVGIVCCASDWGIGKNNGLLFSLKQDMQHFKNITKNAIVVCGENTLKSFPGSKPLQGRSTIVLCPPDSNYENCICVHSFDELVKIVKVLAISQDVYIIGGGMLYKSMLPYYDRVIVTKVDAIDPEATVFFPNLDLDKNFDICEDTDFIKDGDYNIKFITYARCE